MSIFGTSILGVYPVERNTTRQRGSAPPRGKFFHGIIISDIINIFKRVTHVWFLIPNRILFKNRFLFSSKFASKFPFMSKFVLCSINCGKYFCSFMNLRNEILFSGIYWQVTRGIFGEMWRQIPESAAQGNMTSHFNKNPVKFMSIKSWKSWILIHYRQILPLDKCAI